MMLVKRDQRIQELEDGRPNQQSSDYYFMKTPGSPNYSKFNEKLSGNNKSNKRDRFDIDPLHEQLESLRSQLGEANNKIKELKQDIKGYKST